MELQIRKALADDIPHILALQARSLRELSVSTYSAAQIESLVRTQGQARVRSFNSGDEIIYVAYAKVSGDEASHEPLRLVAMAAFISYGSQIGGLYVHPAYARRGIASQLLQAVEAEAVSQRHQVLSVMSSVMAVPFYEARGFRRLFSRAVFFEDEKVACVEMAKSLGSGSLLFAMAKKILKQLAIALGPVAFALAVVWCAVLWL